MRWVWSTKLERYTRLYCDDCAPAHALKNAAAYRANAALKAAESMHGGAPQGADAAAMSRPPAVKLRPLLCLCKAFVTLSFYVYVRRLSQGIAEENN